MACLTVHEYAAALRHRYKAARKGARGKILDEFCQTMGMHRKAAIRLLGKRTRPIFLALAALLLVLAVACEEGEGEPAATPSATSVAITSPTASPTASPLPPAVTPTAAAEAPTAAATPTPSPAPALTPAATATPEADFGRVIFLHHSTGASLIEQGGVRQRLTDLGYEFYDHGYNDDGLVLADGTWTGRNFDVPDDNTDPDGFADIFAQPLHDPPDNTFSHLMQYDVIAFKSCFPVSDIQSDDQLAEYKSYYLSIRDRMDQHPNKIFVVVSPPPQVAEYTDSEAAARARAFSNWLASDEYLSGHPNVFTFDFFDLLADPSTNVLRTDYQTDEYDAHPNELANRTIGPLFADFIDQAIRTYSAR